MPKTLRQPRKVTLTGVPLATTRPTQLRSGVLWVQLFSGLPPGVIVSRQASGSCVGAVTLSPPPTVAVSALLQVGGATPLSGFDGFVLEPHAATQASGRARR